jgi:hypothetical protein
MGATPQTQSTPQIIAQNTLTSALNVLTALQSGNSANHYAVYTGLSQWYEDLEKNVLGRADTHTHYLHILYEALLTEIDKIGVHGPNDPSCAIKAFVVYYTELYKQAQTATSFAVDPELSYDFLGGLGIEDIEYE